MSRKMKVDGIWHLGKHKGVAMELVPTSYLKWFVEDDGQGFMKPKHVHRIKALNELTRRGIAVQVTNKATSRAAGLGLGQVKAVLGGGQ